MSPSMSGMLCTASPGRAMLGPGCLARPLLTGCWALRPALRRHLPRCAASGRALSSAAFRRPAGGLVQPAGADGPHAAGPRRQPGLSARCVTQVGRLARSRLSQASLQKWLATCVAGRARLWHSEAGHVACRPAVPARAGTTRRIMTWSSLAAATQAARQPSRQPGWAAAPSCSPSTWTGSPGRWAAVQGWPVSPLLQGCA